MAVKKVVFEYDLNTQKEFEEEVMASVFKKMDSLKDIDIVDMFYKALGLNAEGFCKGKEYAQVALTHNYQYVFELAQTISKELNLQFTDMRYRAKAVEVTRLKAIKALNNVPKPKPKRAKYISELNIAEVAVMPICTMPNIYFGFYNSGKRFEYKRDKEYLNALKITKPQIGRAHV